MRHGLQAWLVQRLSALYMLAFVLFCLAYFTFRGTPTFAEWRSLMGQPLMMTASALFLFSLLAHAWIGMRDVVMDYVHPLAVRISVLTALAVGLLAMAVWGVHVMVAS